MECWLCAASGQPSPGGYCRQVSGQGGAASVGWRIWWLKWVRRQLRAAPGEPTPRGHFWQVGWAGCGDSRWSAVASQEATAVCCWWCCQGKSAGGSINNNNYCLRTCACLLDHTRARQPTTDLFCFNATHVCYRCCCCCPAGWRLPLPRAPQQQAAAWGALAQLRPAAAASQLAATQQRGTP